MWTYTAPLAHMRFVVDEVLGAPALWRELPAQRVRQAGVGVPAVDLRGAVPAAAIVMVRAERAADHAKRPVHLLGAAAETTHREIASMPDLTVTGALQSGRRAFAQAGVTPADIDVVEVYDAFTINTILFLEDLGFCEKGEGGAFVQGGRIAPGGELPVNTNGGCLSCVHPGMYGLFTVVEATRQLMGLAAGRQVADAKLALAHGNGGVLSSQATVILGTPETV